MGYEGKGKKGEGGGIRGTNFQLKSCGDVTYTVGNIVYGIITSYGVRWLLDLCGDHFIRYINVE